MNIVLVMIACIFFFIKRKLWLATVWHDVAAIAYFYRKNGDNIFKYFLNIGSPLSDYIIAVTYGRSSKLGNIIFDLMLTLTGICLYFITNNIFNSSIVSTISVSMFYFCCLTPKAFEAGGAPPEMYANFFTVVGLMVVSFAVKINDPFLILVGCSIASLGFWAKITAVEILWPLAYIYLFKGISLELLYGLLSLIVMSVGLLLINFISTYRYNEKQTDKKASGNTGFADRIKLFLEYQRYDLSIRYKKLTFQGVLSEINKRLQEHISVIFPILILFLIFLSFEGIGGLYAKLLLTWFVISFLHCVIRLQFSPLYFLMSQYPLSIGAALTIVQWQPFIVKHYFISILVLLIILSMIGSSFRRNTVWPIFKKSFRNIKHNVIDVLSKHISSNDYIFIDTAFPQIYYELGCNGPPVNFIWSDRMRWYLEKSNFQKSFIKYFIEKQPKFYLAIGRTLNLTYLEKLTGLRYEVMNTGFGSFYRLVKVFDHFPTEKDVKLNLDLLYSGDNERYHDDREKLLASAVVFCKEGVNLLGNGQPELALIKFEEAATKVQGVPNINLLRSKALIRLGFNKEAYEALKTELKVQPENKEAKAMLNNLHKKTNTSNYTDLNVCET